MLVAAYLTRRHGNLAKRMIEQLDGAPFPVLPFYNGVPRDDDVSDASWHSPENLYFAGGVNFVVDMISTTFPTCDVAWILNDDLEGVTPEMGERLYGVMERHPSIAMLSPSYNSSHPPTQPHGSGFFRFVSHVDGAAHMIRLSAFRAVGGYDAANFPGWGCDLSLCLVLRRAGWLLAVDDREEVVHDWQRGTAHNDPAIREVYQGGGWQNRLISKHGTREIPGYGGFYPDP